MSPEKGGRKPLTEEEREKLERQRKAWVQACVRHNKQVAARVSGLPWQPELDLEERCGDCGQPMSAAGCPCSDKGVGHHPGRVPR